MREGFWLIETAQMATEPAPATMSMIRHRMSVHHGNQKHEGVA